MGRLSAPAATFAAVGVIELRAEAVAAIETVARECEARGEADRAARLRESDHVARPVS